MKFFVGFLQYCNICNIQPEFVFNQTINQFTIWDKFWGEFRQLSYTPCLYQSFDGGLKRCYLEHLCIWSDPHYSNFCRYTIALLSRYLDALLRLWIYLKTDRQDARPNYYSDCQDYVQTVDIFRRYWDSQVASLTEYVSSSPDQPQPACKGGAGTWIPKIPAVWRGSSYHLQIQRRNIVTFCIYYISY